MHNTQIQKERKRTFEHYVKHLIHISLYDIYLIRLVYIYKHFFAYLVLFFLQLISGIWRILSAKLGGQNSLNSSEGKQRCLIPNNRK